MLLISLRSTVMLGNENKLPIPKPFVCARPPRVDVMLNVELQDHYKYDFTSVVSKEHL